jgi:hypothetical protein
VFEKNDNKLNVTILRLTRINGDFCDLNMSKYIKMVDKMRIYPIVNHGKNLILLVNARDLGKAYYQVLIMPTERAKREIVW